MHNTRHCKSILTFYFSCWSIKLNISRHIISGCDNGGVYFHKFKRAKRVAGNAFSHILITQENTLSAARDNFKYLYTIDDVRISISYVKRRQRVPKGS